MSIDKISTIRVKDNGDWDLNTVLTQENAINQNLLIALREHNNDFFMALDAGLDSTRINDKTEAELINDIQAIVLEQKGITECNILNFKKTGQIIDIIFSYNTILNESNVLVATISV